LAPASASPPSVVVERGAPRLGGCLGHRDGEKSRVTLDAKRDDLSPLLRVSALELRNSAAQSLVKRVEVVPGALERQQTAAERLYAGQTPEGAWPQMSDVWRASSARKVAS
jgi:hypothetical protein